MGEVIGRKETSLALLFAISSSSEIKDLCYYYPFSYSRDYGYGTLYYKKIVFTPPSYLIPFISKSQQKAFSVLYQRKTSKILLNLFFLVSVSLSVAC